MGFRDDRDASRARADALQRELDDALKELGRLQISHLESSEEAEALRKRVEELEKTRASLKRSSAPRSGVRPIVLLLVGLVAVGGVVFYFQARTEQTRAEAALAMANAQLEQQNERRRREEEARARRAEEERRAAEEAERREAEAAARETPSGPTTSVSVAVRRTAIIEWPAKVVKAQGKSLRRGARCTVQARLSSDGTRLDADVDVTCGDEVLYRWAQPLGSGMQMRDCAVGESPGPNGMFTHRLTCSDLGARTGRPQMSLDTEGHTAVVWSEAAPIFRVELRVTGDGLAPGPPLAAGHGGGDAAAFTTVERTARVMSVVGAAPVARGASCTVRVEPRAGNQNCRVELRCGTTVLYGNRSSNGFNRCTIEDGAFVRVEDTRGTSEGGDPRITFDLPASRLITSDGAGGEMVYTVVMSLPRN